jgi:hypothetical protein
MIYFPLLNRFVLSDETCRLIFVSDDHLAASSSLIVGPVPLTLLVLGDSRNSEGQRCNGELARLRKRNDRAVWATFSRGRLITCLGLLAATSPELEIASFGFEGIWKF